MRQRLAKGEAALRGRLRRHIGVDENRQKRRRARIAAEIERDRKGGTEFRIEREGRVEAEIEQLPQQGIAGLAVDRPRAVMTAAALGARTAMDRESRHAMHHEIIAMRVRQHDQEIGVKGAEFVADRAHRRVDPGDLRLVLGFRQAQELRRMRHDRRPDDAGAVSRFVLHAHLASSKPPPVRCYAPGSPPPLAEGF
jgi:hypothetical protein